METLARKRGLLVGAMLVFAVILASMALSALLAGGVALLVAEKPAQAAFPGANGKIVFSSDRSTGAGVDNPTRDDELFKVNPDGTGLTQLTHNTTIDVEPEVSPDGSKVVFSRLIGTAPEAVTQFFTMPITGGTPTQITHFTDRRHIQNPAWSPTGTKIVYAGHPFLSNMHVPDALEIYTIPVSGGTPTRLTNNSHMDHEPVWSPNGTKIAYSSQRNVVTIPASGGTPINVENDATLFSREPDWSPDGTKIAFTGTMGAPQDDDIYTVPASGGTPINLTGSLDSGPPGPDPNDNEQAPAWSPNGTKIVYQDETETIFDEDQFINSFTLTVIPASGGTPTQVTKDPNLEGMQDRFPDWQAIDRTPPKVTSTNPVNTATGVAAGANVIATFSEAMKASTINITTFNLKKSGTSTVLSATVNYNATTKQATLNPSANLQSGATYVATVTTGAKDLAGNSLDQNPITAGNQAKTWSFRVG